MHLDTLRARLERLGRVGGVVAAWTVLACLITAAVLLVGLWKERVPLAGGWDEDLIAVAFTAVGVPVGIGYAVGWAHAAGPYVVGKRVQNPATKQERFEKIRDLARDGPLAAHAIADLLRRTAFAAAAMARHRNYVRALRAGGMPVPRPR